MTLGELYKISCEKLSGTECGEHEARIIIKKVTSLNETDFLLNKNLTITDVLADEVLSMVEKRLSGIPVQYIIGEWDFYGSTFKVDENVLIPRPETEILCEYAINYLKDKKAPVVADLCAGSGCIGITVKKHLSGSRVVMVEKSEGAVGVCRQNIRSILGEGSAELITGDIFLPEEGWNLPAFDLIISNPPYIKSSEIPSLQAEVLLEPEMALDGGEDGLDFYRLLADKWTSYLAEDGMFAFECGEEQAEDIKNILKNKNFDVCFVKDYSNIDRFVIGKRRKNDF